MGGHGNASFGAETPPPARTAGGDGAFPETQLDVLAEAAAGNWTRFLNQYLRPCWQELGMVCRSRGIPPPDADDLYQELMVRLLRHGRFNPQTRQLLETVAQDPEFRANLPGRYLKARTLSVHSAPFRAYLKEVIRNLVFESLRSRKRQPKPMPEGFEPPIEPGMEKSIAESLDKCWTIACMRDAAWELYVSSARARSRGRRRLFEVLYRYTVEDRSAAQIAAQFGIDRTTASGLLTAAKAHYFKCLQRASGVKTVPELREMLAGRSAELRAVFAEVRAAAGAETGEERQP